MRLPFFVLVFIIIIPYIATTQYDSVTFVMEFSGDYISSKSYNYACVYVPTNTKPVTGIISKSGSIYLENETKTIIKVTQQFNGNEFIVPVTTDGCKKIEDRKNSINDGTLSAFIPLGDQDVLMRLKPAADLFGNFEKNVPVTLLLEKNEFSQIEIRVK